MYLVLRLLKKLDFEREAIISASLEDDKIGLCGMLPVFKNFMQAKSVYPDDKIIEIKEANKWRN